jgi:hypothetical protein
MNSMIHSLSNSAVAEVSGCLMQLLGSALAANKGIHP